MNIVNDYRRQFGWRAWPTVLAELPALAGRTVFDLGCGTGDLAAELSSRGAKVIGFDGNEALLKHARERQAHVADFRACDLHTFSPSEPCDGVWCSFTAAYFPSLAERLQSWTSSLRPGGWIALTEVDNLFGHEPLGEQSRALLDAYARQSLQANRYDFYMGRKLGAALVEAGFRVQTSLTLPDRELAFAGPAEPEVLLAWAARLDRMLLLQTFCGSEFAALRNDFLSCLASSEHRSTGSVVCCIAEKQSLSLGP